MYAEREVILCGGTYNSPQLLHAVRHRGRPTNCGDCGIRVHADLPGVGANLSEHLRAGLQFATREPVTFLRELRADRVALSLLRDGCFWHRRVRDAGQQLQRRHPHRRSAGLSRTSS